MELPDTGERTVFETGAQRDKSSGKGYPSDIPPCAERRLASHFEYGALGKGYGRDNWMQGIPLRRYHDALKRHLLSWSEGDVSEDHAAAVLWNMSCAMWTEEQIKSGKLPKELDDLPYRK